MGDVHFVGSRDVVAWFLLFVGVACCSYLLFFTSPAPAQCHEFVVWLCVPSATERSRHGGPVRNTSALRTGAALIRRTEGRTEGPACSTFCTVARTVATLD